MTKPFVYDVRHQNLPAEWCWRNPCIPVWCPNLLGIIMMAIRIPTNLAIHSCRREALRLRIIILELGAQLARYLNVGAIDRLDQTMTSVKLLLSAMSHISESSIDFALAESARRAAHGARLQITTWQQAMDDCEEAPRWRRLETARAAQQDLLEILTGAQRLLDLWAIAETESSSASKVRVTDRVSGAQLIAARSDPAASRTA